MGTLFLKRWGVPFLLGNVKQTLHLVKISLQDRQKKL